MNYPKEFLTVSGYFETKFKEKGSLFIGQVYPVENLDTANILLENAKKKYFDATHHCFALSLVDNTIKYSDDGEPSGTAGIRILNAIQHFKLDNVIVIIIRYFGGTKLGIGPLGKAYYNSAFLTLEQSQKMKKFAYRKFRIIFDFTQLKQVHHILSSLKAKILNSDYSDQVNIEFLIKTNEVSLLVENINQSWKLKPQIIDQNEDLFI